MSYMALYRKFRPTRFSEVKGQDHIVKTLENQMRTGRIGHAYLFCGTRGTGKTTVAKILAKAVNCEHPVDGEPCGECEVCKAIAEGSSMNVIEIDAASNNGVDNIREIKEQVQYSPATGKYKVYIIDEVHMLSIGAFNARHWKSRQNMLYLFLRQQKFTRYRSRSYPDVRDMIFIVSRQQRSRSSYQI